MTLEEFFTDLQRDVGGWGWGLNPAGQIRLLGGHNPIAVCPLTALARYESGHHYNIDQIDMVAAELNISQSSAIRIASAADNEEYSDQDLGERLLQACGIFV